MTDAGGNFTLNVSDVATTLVVSSVGYVTQEVAIGSQSTLGVSLKVDVKSLDEVVVVSYGTVKRSNLTEAVGIVNMAERRKSRRLRWWTKSRPRGGGNGGFGERGTRLDGQHQNPRFEHVWHQPGSHLHH